MGMEKKHLQHDSSDDLKNKLNNINKKGIMVSMNKTSLKTPNEIQNDLAEYIRNQRKKLKYVMYFSFF